MTITTLVKKKKNKANLPLDYFYVTTKLQFFKASIIISSGVT